MFKCKGTNDITAKTAIVNLNLIYIIMHENQF